MPAVHAPAPVLTGSLVLYCHLPPPQFGASLQQRALDNFASVGVDVRLGVRVVEVSQDTISLKSGEKLDYGVCVWSTGGWGGRGVMAGGVEGVRQPRQGRQ